MADSTHGVAPLGCEPSWGGPGGSFSRPAISQERPLEVTHEYVRFYHRLPGMSMS